MDYRAKAFIQNLVSKLPSALSYDVYYFIQRHFGGLRKNKINPAPKLQQSLKVIHSITGLGLDVKGKTFFELGTGRTLDVPMGLWLSGASGIYTIDLNPYLKTELVFDSLEYYRRHEEDIRAIFKEYTHYGVFEQRSKLLSGFHGATVEEFMALLNIKYLAPMDAASVPLKDNTVDYYFSINVLEHIPPDILKAIVVEAKRITKTDGLQVHLIDPSDHFSHSDRNISSINFLKFPEKRHVVLSANRYMYHNRLRASDYYRIFAQAGIKVISKQETVEKDALELLKRGFLVDEKYKDYSPDDLAVTRMGIIGR